MHYKRVHASPAHTDGAWLSTRSNAIVAKGKRLILRIHVHVNKHRTHTTCPAHSKCRSLTQPFASRFAPRSNSMLATSNLPQSAATYRAVHPYYARYSINVNTRLRRKKDSRCDNANDHRTFTPRYTQPHSTNLALRLHTQTLLCIDHIDPHLVLRLQVRSSIHQHARHLQRTIPHRR